MSPVDSPIGKPFSEALDLVAIHIREVAAHAAALRDENASADDLRQFFVIYR
jgi:hypothetical protein